MIEEIEVGEQDMSRAAACRRAINKLIKATTANTFDLMDLLYESKAKNYYSGWGFETFSKFAKSLDIKYSKSYYLVAIKENMIAAGLERNQYEPVGLGKLRVIAKLEPESEYKGTPVSLLIRELTLKAKEMSLEEIQFEVDTILGLTEDESMVWLNIRLKKLARENVVNPGLAKAKRFMGQQKDEEGEYHDASDGAAMEMVFANFLADPNFDTQEDAETPPNEPVATEALESNPETAQDE
jgi:hypothetical protein